MWVGINPLKGLHHKTVEQSCLKAVAITSADPESDLFEILEQYHNCHSFSRNCDSLPAPLL